MERFMTAISEKNEESTLESRLVMISSILHKGKVEGREVIDHEINDDLFVKDFIHRNNSILPESAFVLNRLKKARFTFNEQ